MKKDIFKPGAVYHIFNKGNNGENIFIELRNYEYFLNLMKKYLLPAADIYCYCLLKNHFHLLLRIKDVDMLPDKYKEKPHLAFSHLFNTYSQSFNKAYNRSGSLFQEHLHRNIVEDERYLLQLVAYIHLNPVKHRFSEDFKSYPYSSYKAYKSKKPSSLSREYIISLFEDYGNFEYWHDLEKIRFENLITEVEKYDL